MKLHDTKAVARFLDLSERRVRQLRDKGVIEEYSGSPGLYDLSQTTRKYINYLRNRNPETDESIDYNTERAKLIQAKRRDVEFDLRLKEGDLHESSEVETVISNIFVVFKSRMMAIPAKLSPILSKKTDKAEIFKLLKDGIDEALIELSDFDKAFGKYRETGKEEQPGGKANESGDL